MDPPMLLMQVYNGNTLCILDNGNAGVFSKKKNKTKYDVKIAKY